jgi:amino acid permease
VCVHSRPKRQNKQLNTHPHHQTNNPKPHPTADPRRVTAAGRPLPPRDKAFAAFSALGSVAFAYSFSAVLLEVQDTLREPPPAARTMRKAILASLATTFVAYVGVGFAGYAALGDATPGNILTGFTSPAAVVTLANAAVLVHMVPAYQVRRCAW